MTQQFNYIHLFLVLLLVGIAAYVSSGEITGAAFYRDAGYAGNGFGGFGGFGYGGFLDIYYEYGSVIDAAIFLLIFLGVGKSMFKKKFGEGGTAVYTGVGLFLAFALLLWEEQTGIYLLTDFGTFAMVFIVLILIAGIYYWLKQVGASTPVAFGVMLFGFLLMLYLTKASGIAAYDIIMNFLLNNTPDFGEKLQTFVEGQHFLRTLSFTAVVSYILWYVTWGRHLKNKSK